MKPFDPAMQKLAVDADCLLYKAAVFAEEETQWDRDFWTLSTNLARAKDYVRDALEDWRVTLTPYVCGGLATNNVTLCFSDPSGRYFRHDILPSYKAGRVEKRKPLGYRQLRRWASVDYHCTWLDGLEGDDIVGMLMTKAGDEHIGVSPDKDLLTVPGVLYNPATGVLHRSTEECANLFHMHQTLSGDRTDGYTGCPGVGPVKADRILATAGPPCPSADWRRDVWRAVVAAFEAAGLRESDAVTQASVARIMRHSPFDAFSPFSHQRFILPEGTTLK